MKHQTDSAKVVEDDKMASDWFTKGEITGITWGVK